MRKTTITLAAAAVTLTALLSGCTAGSLIPSPSTTAAADDSTATSSPSTGTPTPTATAAGTVPTSCAALVAGRSGGDDFTKAPLNDPGFVEPGTTGILVPNTPAPGASDSTALKDAVRLRCVWRDPQADTTGLVATVAVVDPALAARVIEADKKLGWECGAIHEGTRCQVVVRDPDYPVDDADTIFSRGDVFVTVQQSNVATNDLIGTIAANVFP